MSILLTFYWPNQTSWIWLMSRCWKDNHPCDWKEKTRNTSGQHQGLPQVSVMEDFDPQLKKGDFTVNQCTAMEGFEH